MKCLYLTHSIAKAVQLQKEARSASIRIHRAADLAELRILLQITGAKVIVVDFHFFGRRLTRLLDHLTSSAQHCSIVVAAPEVYADQWEEVIFAGAFDLILFPFNRDEVSGVLYAAHALASEHLSNEARRGRVRNILAAVQRQARGGVCQEIKPLRTA